MKRKVGRRKKGELHQGGGGFFSDWIVVVVRSQGGIDSLQGELLLSSKN